MAQVRHPNVLQIVDLGEFTLDQDDTVHPMQYIVMEYVPGNTLRFTMSEEGCRGVSRRGISNRDPGGMDKSADLVALTPVGSNQIFRRPIAV